MTAPRQVLPGRTYLVTRRCSQRQYLLRPDEKTSRIFLYCLAESAQRFGIEVIAWCVMSNHWHGVVHDPKGTLPAFLERLHKLSAKALNLRWSRRENLWAAEACSAVHLVEASDVIDKVVYALSNPVTAHLVDRGFDWPGASSLRCLGRAVSVERPKLFFRERGPMPRQVTLVAALPREWQGGRDAWVARIHEAVRMKEQAAREHRRLTGTRLVGRKTVRRRPAFDRPSSYEPRRALRPTLACRSQERRAHELAALRSFRAAYARARARLASGDRSVVFPAGTYLLVVWGVVQCEPRAAPADS